MVEGFISRKEFRTLSTDSHIDLRNLLKSLFFIEYHLHLKVEVSAVSLSDGRLLAGPLLSHTDPVLSSPRPPPKR